MKPEVFVFQEQVPSYRIPLFRSLARELEVRDLNLRVISSAILPDSTELGFQHQRIRSSRAGRPALPVIRRERPAVLVLPHSAQFAPLAAITRVLQGPGRRQVLWGMGLARRYGVAIADQNGTATKTRSYGDVSPRGRRPVPEAVRRSMLSACDHYLSYTEASTANIVSHGYNNTKITTLNNAVEPLASSEQIQVAQRVPLRVLFVAALVEDKEPLTGVRIVERLRALAPGATLHIVGDGPLRNQCDQASSSRSWMRCHGPRRGQELRELALASDIALIPGRVGLAVLEMASAGLPMTTLAAAHHGSEIAYLQDGVNGFFLDSSIDIAAKELHALLTDRPRLERMRREAVSTAAKYTVRNMAVNFANGVVKSL